MPIFKIRTRFTPVVCGPCSKSAGYFTQIDEETDSVAPFSTEWVISISSKSGKHFKWAACSVKLGWKNEPVIDDADAF